MNATLVISVMGAVIGTLGFLLSLLNTWRLFDRDRVRIKVFAKEAFTFPQKTPCLAIEVVNLGFTAITIREVGFKRKNDPGRFVLIKPIIADRSELPLRLEPRQAFTAYSDQSILEKRNLDEIKWSYATTDCLRTFHSDKGFFNRLRRNKSFSQTTLS